MSKNKAKLMSRACLGLAVSAVIYNVQAMEIYSDDSNTLNFDLSGAIGLFHSDKNYNQWGNKDSGGSNWQEAFVKYGLSGTHATGSDSHLYGAFSMVTSGSFGDGDAGGFTNGTERLTKIEDASLGWRSGNMFPALGKDGLDFSFGRQPLFIGDGFLVAGDGLNFGKGLLDDEWNRGGAYYITARRTFDRTAILRLGGKEGIHGTAGWFKSDNPAQADTEMLFSTLEYTEERGTVGLTYLKGLSVDKQLATGFYAQRDDLDVYSIRAQGNAGVPDLFLNAEYAIEDRPGGRENAWNAEAAYTFSDKPWKPTIGYRFSRYSKEWDSLFNGFSRGYGTWFQGEIAANYSGPFNSNNSTHMLYLKGQPSDTVSVGATFYDFSTLHKRDALNFDGQELDLYLDWVATPNVVVSPLVGLYKPSADAEHGGVQLGDNNLNVYGQLIINFTF